MTLLLVLNVALFLVVGAPGVLAMWFGWKITGGDDPRYRGDGGTGVHTWSPAPDLPSGSLTRVGTEDLARSA